MLGDKQEQHVESNSTAIQAGENVTVIQNNGLSYSDVKEVALDVFTNNFYILAGKAQDVARERAEQITEDFLKKLQKENPEGFSKAEDPDFQHALFTIQKEYARNGDEDLGDLLIDLLVDRSKQEQRDILQIVLNESLNVAPKLTDNQLAALAIIFFFKYTQNYGVLDHNKLGENLDRVESFIDKLSKNISCYQHLEFSSCGSINTLSSSKLEKNLGTTYQGLFLKGFDPDEITKRNLSIGMDPRFFIPCENDTSKMQVNAINIEMLEEMIDKAGLVDADKKQLLSLFDLNKMSDDEIKQKCIEIRPYMDTLFDIWNNSYMSRFTLTSVGIAIGHANIKRSTGEFSDLSIWIN